MADSNESKPARPRATIPAMPDDLLSSETPAAAPTPAPVPAPPAPPAAPAAPAEPPVVLPRTASGEIDYGLLESLRSGQAAVTDAVQNFVKKLGDYLSKALDDAASLEVCTYVSEDLGSVDYKSGEFTGDVRLRAITRVMIDGDAKVCIPEKDGELDTAVWAIHMDMVRQAEISRTELMRTMVSAAANLANIFTPKS